MIFTRRFGALAARPQFPDAPELQQELSNPLDLDAELAKLTGEVTGQSTGDVTAARDDDRRADESAA
ncbi:hypothetical protein EV645_4043 [Kribbella rubisoli]|uniref:Uncharacterized protein n=1 Tax=Kribbella rubisoli TaxID=3075929 RepID=A0A4V2FY70_9ACTN|nr:hypothetical protein [Kribbella rubisoli]RZU16476.1 hypothetical protein EV645_4043 [Kribbella rubisoli]